jgi:hypothetical protein
MPGCFRLAPKDLSHVSWQYSKTPRAVRIIAHDEQEARQLVADALRKDVMIEQSGRFEKIVIPPSPSPWADHSVTSCEIYWGGPCDELHIIADDGEKWPRQ